MFRAEVHIHALFHRMSQVGFQTMLMVHALLVLSACWLALSRGRWVTLSAWVAVMGCSLAWFGVNQRWEGDTLYAVRPTHGLTQADLVVPAVIGIALVVRALRWRAGKSFGKPGSV